MKKCRACKLVLPCSEFHKHPTNKDRLCGACKQCVKREDRQRRQRTGGRPRPKLEDVSMRRRWKSNARLRAPERTEARRIMYNALRTGKLKRPSECEGCSMTVPVQGHHYDYKKPLDVHWLCRLCHQAEHGGHA